MRNCFLLIIAVFTMGSTSFSQDLPDSKGREFYMAFLPNSYHRTVNRDSIFICITAEKPASGKIEYTDTSGTAYSENFTISDVSKSYIFTVPNTRFEHQKSKEESVSKTFFRVVSDEDVTVYGVSLNTYSSDGFLALPVDVLGMHYFIMSYYNHPHGYLTGDFVVVAVEDGTTVQIVPSVPTKKHSTNKQTIVLNKGETYFVEAQADTLTKNYDLTGTEITSNKPVAVFAGHECASITNTKTTTGSGDLLIEQMIPVSYWGNNAFIIPFIPGLDEEISSHNDKYRVMAACDSTRVIMNGTDTVYLNKGKYLEKLIYSVVSIEADKPILTAHFKKSSNITNVKAQPNADPFMVLVPSKEQFLDKYRVVCLRSITIDGTSTLLAIVEQYINVVVPETAYMTLKLDGFIVPKTSFTKIAGRAYYYARLNVDYGDHYLECNEPFGAIVYGYGAFNSYGFSAGISFSAKDNPPVVTVTDSCFSVTGTVTDSSGLESGLSDITAPSVNIENAIVSINSFQKDDKAAAFSAKLIDRYKDGKFTIVATDSAGNVASKEIGIPGFTVSHPYTYTADTIPVYSPKLTIGTKYCFRIPIYNYGAYEQTVQALSVGNPAITINHATPHKLGVKETDSVELCILIANNDPIDDILYLTGPCGTRPIAKISAGKTDCDETMFVYDDFDNDPFIEYNASAKRAAKNIRLTPSKPNTKGSCWRTLKMPVRKGFVTEFAFSVSDGFNHTSAENSLPGADGLAFVIQNEGLGVVGNYGAGIGYDGIGNSVAVEFDLFHNDSTQLFDYYDPDGNHVAVQSLGTQPNSSAHTKQATLGITDTLTTIKPNGRPYYARIEYNLLPNVLRVYLNNTRVFTTPVLEVKNFKLENYVSLERDEFAYVGFTAATANSFEIHEILNWYFCPKPTDGIQTGAEDQIDNGTGLLIYPNPAGDYLNVNLHGNSGEIAIYSLLGEEVKRLGADGNTRVDISELPRGCYIVRINYNNGQSITCSFIKK